MLTIIIVSYNSAQTVLRCQSELLASARYPVIVVDNASSDGSADVLEKRFPDIRVMRMPQNLGYGRAANRGLAEVKTPYAFLLNPDLEATVVDVQAMLDFADRHADEASLFAPAVVGKDYQQCGAINREWVIGAAMFFKMADFEKIGLFDENIFLFSEETDLCRRLVVGGHKILLNTDVYLNHLKGQSSTPNPKIDALKNWHRGWSKMYYLHKHGLINEGWASIAIYFRYKIKGMLATSLIKRQRYAFRAKGVHSYLKGASAFMPDGSPQLLLK